MKVVLTGGPCGGKSDALKIIKTKLVNDGYNVSVLPEVARPLLNLGYLDEIPIDIKDFQNILFIIQFINEYKMEKENKILLCDRGLFDGLAYINQEMFNEILLSNKLNKDDLLKTYNAVLYFKTLAYDDPKRFKKARIYETIQDGINKDKKLYEIWNSKILNQECPYYDTFDEKLNYLYKYLMEYLNTYKDDINLSDIYNEEYLIDLENNLDEILNKYALSKDIKRKTKGIII